MIESSQDYSETKRRQTLLCTRTLPGTMRNSEKQARQKATSISQVTQSQRNFVRHNSCHDNKTIFFQMWGSSQRYSGPTVDSAASVRDQTSTQPLNQVYPTAAVAGRGNRGRHAKWNESVRVHAKRDCTTTASQPPADAVLGVRRWLRTRWPGGLVRHGCRRAKQHSARCQLHQ